MESISISMYFVLLSLIAFEHSVNDGFNGSKWYVSCVVYVRCCSFLSFFCVFFCDSIVFPLTPYIILVQNVLAWKHTHGCEFMAHQIVNIMITHWKGYLTRAHTQNVCSWTQFFNQSRHTHNPSSTIQHSLTLVVSCYFAHNANGCYFLFVFILLFRFLIRFLGTFVFEMARIQRNCVWTPCGVCDRLNKTNKGRRNITQKPNLINDFTLDVSCLYSRTLYYVSNKKKWKE